MGRRELPKVNLDALIDEILSSESAEETRQEHPTVGLQERYFSEHDRNIHIISGFDYSFSWMKKHNDLAERLEYEFDEWWEDEKSTFDFEQWFYGGRIEKAAMGHDLGQRLISHYRGRIEEVHHCESCGREISEKYDYDHPSSLHRIGERLSADEVWEYHIYCKYCWRSPKH